MRSGELNGWGPKDMWLEAGDVVESSTDQGLCVAQRIIDAAYHQSGHLTVRAHLSGTPFGAYAA